MLRRLCARGGLMHGLACRSMSSYQSRLAALNEDARRALDATRERLKQAVAAAAAAGADGADRPSSAPLPVEEALAVIEMTFDEYGAEPYFGEPVTHLEHALKRSLGPEQAPQLWHTSPASTAFTVRIECDALDLLNDPLTLGRELTPGFTLEIAVDYHKLVCDAHTLDGHLTLSALGQAQSH